MRVEQNFRDVETDGPVHVHGPDGRSFETNLDPGRVDYVTTEGVEVYIERPAKGTKGGTRTRFVDAGGNQVGPIQANLVPAILYARAQGWRDPTTPDWWNDACTEEVRAGGAPDDRHFTNLGPR
jgi:hypothetical protein